MPAADIAAVVLRPGIVLSRLVAAALCRRSPHCVRQAVEAGTLPADYRGSHPYVTSADLARWSGTAGYSASDFSAAFARLNPKTPRRGDPAAKDHRSETAADDHSADARRAHRRPVSPTFRAAHALEGGR